MQALPQPNNLGPTLLLVVGLLTLPLGLGIPLVLLGLAQIRTVEGRPAVPLLASQKRRLWRALRTRFAG